MFLRDCASFASEFDRARLTALRRVALKATTTNIGGTTRLCASDSASKSSAICSPRKASSQLPISWRRPVVDPPRRRRREHRAGDRRSARPSRRSAARGARHREVISRRARALRRLVRRAPGRGPCAARRERRRQIDPDQDRVRGLPARRRLDPRRRQAGRLFHARTMRGAPASRRSIRNCCCFPSSASPRTSFSATRPLAGAAASTGGRCAPKPSALLDSLEIDDLAPDQIVGALTVGNRQRVEILRALSQDARILIMDEPTAALTESDVTRLFDIVRRLQAARRRHRLYQPPPRRDFRDRRSRHRAARRRLCRHRATSPTPTSAELVQMMVGRRIESLFPKIGRADRRAGAGSARSRAPAADQGRQPHRARRRDRRPCRARRLGPQRTGADAVRHDAEPSPARSGSTARRCESDSPETARAMASPMCRKIAARRAWSADERPAQFLARRARQSLSRFGFIDRAAERRMAQRGRHALQRQDKFGRRDRRPAFRRQSAEDRARQVARQQSEAADPRRADARHRRRRQGRDPSPDERARRRRASPS